MPNYKIMFNEHLEDLNPVCGGEAQVRPGAVHFPYLHTASLHYVVSGRGMLSVDGVDHPVKAGQAFVLSSDVHAKFTADEHDPWCFRWVGFSGTLTAAFLQLPAVFDAPEDTLIHMQGCGENDFPPMLPYELVGDLYRLYARVIQPKEQLKDHIQNTVDYIQSHYPEPLTIETIAAHVGLNPFYLSKLFKKKTGHTLQHHILCIRLAEVKRCLLHSYSVKEAASMCGFSSTAVLYRQFKQEFGLTPITWKKQCWGQHKKSPGQLP